MGERVTDEIGSLPMMLGEEWWKLPMGGGTDDNHVRWDAARAGVEAFLAAAHPQMWEALTEEGRRACEVAVSRALLSWLATWARWESPVFARRWNERGTDLGRAYSMVQLAAALRMDAPPDLPACAAYLEHVRTCEEGCSTEEPGLVECEASVPLHEAAMAEYDAAPRETRRDRWKARP